MKDYLKENYDEGLDLFGYPQEYKGIKIYPIKIKDLKYQKLFYKLLCQPKNYIANKDVLKSSYLKFIIYVLQGGINPDGQEFYKDTLDFLKYITKEDVILEFKEQPGEGLQSVGLRLKIGDKFYIEEDFDDIREICLEQNGLSIEYIEDYNPGLEESLNFMNRKSEGITLQDKIFTFCAMQKLGLKDIEDYTMFQFESLFEKAINLKEYDLYKPLLVTGQLELKSGEIKNYLYRSVKTGRYDSIKLDADDFMQNSDVIKASKPL